MTPQERARKILKTLDCQLEAVADHIAEAEAAARAKERERCAKIAEDFIAFTGAGYCDIDGPQWDPQRAHDYGRGGCYVQRRIAAAIREALPA